MQHFVNEFVLHVTDVPALIKPLFIKKTLIPGNPNHHIPLREIKIPVLQHKELLILHKRGRFYGFLIIGCQIQ